MAAGHLEPALDRTAVGDRGIHAAPEQHLKGCQNHGLARSGLACQRGEPGSGRHSRRGDDSEVLDAQFTDHGCVRSIP